MADIEPSVENHYQVGSTTTFSRELWNAVFASISARLAARELLEADFEALIGQGTQQALDVIQQNVGPRLADIIDKVMTLEAAIEALVSGGTAPNSLMLGGQLPAYYLALANATGTLPAEKVAGLSAVVLAQIDALKNGAPEILDTFKEIADALGNNPNLAADVMAALGGKLAKSANLSDLPDAPAARTNLGLGALAQKDKAANGDLADMASARFKARTSAGVGSPEDLTATQAKALLALVIADVSGLQAAIDARASRSGDTFTGEVEVQTTLWIHRSGVKRAGWHVDAGGILNWLDQGGASHFRVLPNGKIETQFFGDLGQHIENRAYQHAVDQANAAAHYRLTEIGSNGGGDLGVPIGGRADISTPYGFVTGVTTHGGYGGVNVLHTRNIYCHRPDRGWTLMIGI